MKKVLFISYHFPPIAMSQRALKFVKYLPKFDWTPIVLTPKKTNYPIDITLLEEIPKQCQIIRLDTCKKCPPAFISLSDFIEGWFPITLKEGIKVIEEQNIDVIYSVAAPFLSLVSGVALKRLTGKPLVVDLRDEWTTNPYFQNLDWNYQNVSTKQFEKQVLKEADAVISVTDEIVGTLNRLSGGQQRSKFHTIPNGFDPSDFEHIKNTPQKKKFTLGYMGSIYGLRLATANQFFKSLNTAIQNQIISSSQIKVLLIGGDIPNLPYQNVNRIISRTGFVNHRSALSLAASCDILLLFIDPREGNQIVTSKIFELINLGKPIIAIVPPQGVAANIIRETRTGFVIDSRSPASAIPTIDKIIQSWKKGTNLITPNTKSIQKYDRKNQAGALAYIMDQLIKAK